MRTGGSRAARARRLLPVVLCLALAGAGLTAVGPTEPVGAVAGPVPGADWVVETPASHGMDPVLLDQARQYAFADGKNTQGVVVVHAGVIVAEWYAPGEDQDSWAASWSVAKSFTSALIGIAIDEGKIPGVDEPMTTWYPSWIGTPLASITLRDVLHMETGRDWNEDYSPTSLESSNVIQMVSLHGDQLAYAAGIGPNVPPGTDFNYSSGDTMLLSGVLQQATGMRADEYARQKLLDPIGISQFEWWQDAAGHTLTYCCVDTTSRDFARFGLLYLRDGQWGSTQVVPASWVQDSITDTANTYGGYGYQWWLQMGGGGSLPPHFSAIGHDGQYIYVFPTLDLVVVRNGSYTKSPCPPIADPNLLYYYPPQGLVPGQGTAPPDSWSETQFLGPIVSSLTGTTYAPADTGADQFDAGAAEAIAPGTATAVGQVQAEEAAAPYPCPVAAEVTTTTTAPPATVAPVAAVTPAFTG